jgi:DNA-binding CsgD family transcriptional regulator
MLHLDTLGLHVTTMQAAWDRLPYGVVVVDAAGRMLWSNRAGGEILAENDHLVVRGLVLHASASDVDRELCKLISEAARTGSDGGLHAGGALQVPRRAPARPLSVLVSPLRPGEPGAFFLPSSAAVLLLVIDPDRRRELPPMVLMRLYQLTRMEAALAVRIASGMTLERAADELTIATSTARLHLQRVLRKTGTHRQVELVRLLLTVIPPGL